MNDLKKIIVSAIVAIILLEVALWGGAFFSGNLLILAIGSLFSIVFGAAIVEIVRSFLGRGNREGVRELARTLARQKQFPESRIQSEPEACIRESFERAYAGEAELRNKFAIVSSIDETIIVAASVSGLITGVGRALSTTGKFGAVAALSVEKTASRATVYSLYPESDPSRTPLKLGADGISLDSLKLPGPVSRKNLSEAEVPNKLEEFFIEKGMKSSYTIPIEYTGEFYGLFAVASLQEGGVNGDDQLMIKEVSALVGLKLAFIKTMADLLKKGADGIGERQDRKTEVDKQLADLKEMYQQVTQSGKMASLGQLAAGIAHEINNPIGGILGYTQLILSKLRNQTVARADIDSSIKYLEMMERESKRCQWIVSNLLNFARKPLDERSVLNMRDVIENTISMMEFQAQQQNIRINLTFPPEGLKPVFGNANELQQVFTNLVQNAEDAMNEGGEINIIAANKVDERYKPPLEYVEIVFADSGCGIPKEHLDKIFEPFFTNKVGKPGTGLGLSISYAIVTAHKGLIKVTSEKGKGTTFTINLPAHKEEKHANP